MKFGGGASNLGLYSTKAVIILDSEGKRLLSKYYTPEYPTIKEQKVFEKALFDKTRRMNSEIILFDGHVVVYKNVVDVFIYFIGPLDDNELMLHSVLVSFNEALMILLGYVNLNTLATVLRLTDSLASNRQVEKRTLLENGDIMMIALDETIDDGLVRQQPVDVDDIHGGGQPRRPVIEKVVKASKKSKKKTKGETEDLDSRLGNDAIRTVTKSEATTTKQHIPKTLKDEINVLQSRFPQHILFVQVGGFYEIYEYQTYMEEIASLLDLSIGGRDTKFAGFPVASLNRYVERLLAKGRTVAIVDQVAKDSISSGKNFTRDVTRIITPGTAITEAGQDGGRENCFLLTVVMMDQKKGRKASTAKVNSDTHLGLAWTDVNTGDFVISECTVDTLLTELARVSPKEVLIQESLAPQVSSILTEKASSDGFLLTTKPDSWFKENKCIERYTQFEQKLKPELALPFRKTSSKSNHTGLSDLSVLAAGTILSYINEVFCGLDPFFHVSSSVETEAVMKIDPATMQSLEITRTIREKDIKGSLLNTIDNTKTAAGSRLLSSRIRAPSTSINEINRRLNLAEVFQKDTLFLADTRSQLSLIRDMERCVQRMHLNSARPIDLSNIIQTLSSVSKLKKSLLAYASKISSTELEESASRINPLDEITAKYEAFFGDPESAPSKLASLGVVSDGFSKELDSLRKKYEKILDAVKALEAKLSMDYGVDIVLAEDPRDGPVLSVPIGKSDSAAILKKVNADEDVEEMARQKHTTRRKFKHSVRVESQTFKLIRDRTEEIISTSKAIAEIDVAASSAIAALDRGYVKPNIVDGDIIDIKHGRHPVVESMQTTRGSSFIPNDIHLGGEEPRSWLLTGPNMGGKSTFLRQCALITIMAQAGLFVPATEATLGIVDQVFSRVGSSDNLAGNQSTFMVEMVETANILKHATSRSLVIVDEIGRGTSSQDGLSLATAILEHLVQVNKSLTLFATHYHELSGLLQNVNAESLKNVKCMKTMIHMNKDGSFSYLYEIHEGISERSYGIQVASLAGEEPSAYTPVKIAINVVPFQVYHHP
ncbi:Mismatch repair protein msh3 [Chytridiales sp. JEL 0842]|nr:Mismatch repair protein msh3 [Chytridiales sp. JEL 0842]